MKELLERQEEGVLTRTWRERAVCKGWPSRNCNILRGVHLIFSIPRGRNLRELGISALLSFLYPAGAWPWPTQLGTMHRGNRLYNRSASGAQHSVKGGRV